MTARTPAAFNLDANRVERRRAVKGAQRERAREPFRFIIGKEHFELKAQLDWPINSAELVEAQEWTRLLHNVLVGDGVQRFFALDPIPSIQDVNDIFEAFSQWAGVGDLPNSDEPQPPASTPT